MSILIALIVGGIVGWLAAAITGRNEGILGSIAIGIIGSIIGSGLAHMLGNSTQGYLAASWSSLLWAFIGALILSAILNTVQHRTHHNV